jgi:uncharacterized membrane protein YoaK (UPF0700 family)
MTDIHSLGERLDVRDIGLALLALASGSTDVTAFLKLGNVFTSAMTGNTALLGIAIAHGSMLAASLALSALLGFILGAATATAICELRGEKIAMPSVLRPLLLLETLCLSGFAATWTLVGHPVEDAALYVLITTSAAGMGIQSVAARKINAPGISTIVFTSTLTSIVMSVAGTVVRRPNRLALTFGTKRQIGIFLAYGFGSVLAGMLDWSGVGLIVWIPLAAVLGALACYELAWRLQRSGS